MRYHLTPVIIAIIKKSTNNKGWKGVETRELSYTVVGNVNWYSNYGEHSTEHSAENIAGRFLKRLKIELSYDKTIPVLGT